MGWITSNIILQYFSEPLHKKVEAYCKKENQNVKILLIIDNCTGHPRALMDLSEKIKVGFLSPNATPLFHLIDQGATATFKAHCLRRTFEKLTEANDDETKPSIKEFCKKLI
jgi:hypothetical protein